MSTLDMEELKGPTLTGTGAVDRADLALASAT